MQPRGDVTYVVTSVRLNTKSFAAITVLLSYTWKLYGVCRLFPLINARGRSSAKKKQNKTCTEETLFRRLTETVSVM